MYMESDERGYPYTLYNAIYGENNVPSYMSKELLEKILTDNLTSNQLEVIKKRYEYGYSIFNIGNIHHISLIEVNEIVETSISIISNVELGSLLKVLINTLKEKLNMRLSNEGRDASKILIKSIVDNIDLNESLNNERFWIEERFDHYTIQNILDNWSLPTLGLNIRESHVNVIRMIILQFCSNNVIYYEKKEARKR